MSIDFLVADEHGEVKYIAEKDALVFTSSSGNSQTIRIENGDLIMEDGTVYYNSGTAMQKVSDKIAACIKKKNYEKASEMMAITAELVSSGLLQADSSFFSAVPAIAENAETLIKKKQTIGADMLMILSKSIVEICDSGSTDGQAAFDAVSSLVDVCERLAKKQLDPAFEVLMISMDSYLAIAEAGVFGDDFAIIEQFKNLHDRCEQIINEYY
jgi:hypothetical protein